MNFNRALDSREVPTQVRPAHIVHLIACVGFATRRAMKARRMSLLSVPALFALSSCAEDNQPPLFTFAWDLNDRNEIVHTTLMREVRKHNEATYVSADRYNFPSAYYVYRDNLKGGPQSVIGILVDTETFGPLTKTISAENAVSPANDFIKLYNQSRYKERSLFLSLRGRSPAHPRKLCREQQGVSITSKSEPCRSADIEDDVIKQYPCLETLIHRPVKFECLKSGRMCSLTFQFNNTSIHFAFPIDQACRSEFYYERLLNTIKKYHY